MIKLDRLGVSNTPPVLKDTKPVLAGDLNKVIDKVNKVIDDLVEFVDISSTSYTLLKSSHNRYIRADNEDPITIMVPTYSDVEFSIGTTIVIEQSGAGTVTIKGDTGVTINGNLSTGGQYTIVVLVKTSTNTWTCIGGV